MSAKEAEDNKRKRSTTEPDAASTKKPPQKLRAPNAYNIFHENFFNLMVIIYIHTWVL